MDSGRWHQISSLFAAALEREGEERRALLDPVDPDLRREVESLLTAHESVGALDRLAHRMDDLRKGALAGTARESATLTMGGSSDAREAAPGLEAGRRLGRYEIRDRLGAGGMGEVYRSYDTRLMREVAVKIIGRRVRQRPGALQRFEQEARAASALNHPNIITVYDIGEEDSVPYIVMELVEGESLRSMLRAPWPLEPLLRFGVQVTDGLVAAHERQIVHRDLKPENILMDPRGIAKILDFGLAQLRLDEADEPEAGSAAAPNPREGLLGTLGYMSPEIVSGKVVDHRSDQFSLGTILYEMATGAPAFGGRTSLEALADTLRGEPRSIEQLRPDLPRALVQTITRCLRKDPSERYDSTRTILDELRAARRSAVRGAAPGPTPARLNLPAPRTRLIGRQRELQEIERLLVDEQVRLLTLTGAGGTGKTRLALEAAPGLASHFVGGVYFVPLGSISDPALVATTLVQAVGGVAAAGRSALSSVIADLRAANAPTLLVLDNFEQVMDAASVVSELLAACPDLTVMVTSREVLRLYGEHGFPLSPLEQPDPGQLTTPERLGDFAAVTLFVERARAANPGFGLTEQNAAAVAKLCAGLDGLPLAIELAAAQTQVLSPDAMLSRLEDRLGLLTGGPRDLPGRQQTLRRTIDWSHQLLDATEQAIFRRLATFAAGFTLEAARAVVDPFGTIGRPLEEGIRALLNKSLLQARDAQDGEPRFSMLETLRDYALERLEESGEDAKTRKAHAAYFLVLAEEGTAALTSSSAPGWLERLDTEHDNFRAALEWLTREGQAEWGLRLALALFPFWERGEHLAEGRRRLEALLDLEASLALPAERVKAMFAAGVLASTQGDVGAGIRLHSQCLRIYRDRNDPSGIVVALVALGNQHVAEGEYEKARSLLEQSLEVWQQLGDQTGFARSLSNLAFVARGEGRWDEARALYKRASSMFDRLGDRLSCAWAANHEGNVAREQGDDDAAASLYRTALAAFRDLGDAWGIGSSLADLGTVARQRGDYDAAGRFYREALASFVGLDHRRGIARVLESLACLAAEEGQVPRGMRLAAAASVLRDRVGAPLAPALRGELERSLGNMQRLLGAEAAHALWREGATMPMAALIALAAAE